MPRANIQIGKIFSNFITHKTKVKQTNKLKSGIKQPLMCFFANI